MFRATGEMACPSKLPAQESWLLSLQKIGSEIVSLAPLRVSVWFSCALPLDADNCRIACVCRCSSSSFGQIRVRSRCPSQTTGCYVTAAQCLLVGRDTERQAAVTVLRTQVTSIERRNVLALIKTPITACVMLIKVSRTNSVLLKIPRYLTPAAPRAKSST
jgi:hypothetical protein